MRTVRALSALVVLAVPALLATGVNPVSAAGASVTGVTGKVTSAATGKPLAGICVNVIEASTNSTVGTSAPTTKKGVWVLNGIPASTDYTAIAYVCKSGDYVAQWYDGQDFQTDATQFPVPAGATTGGINFSLSEGGAVSGKVTDATTKKPVAGILVVAYYTTAFQAATYAECTTAKGTYSLTGVPTSGVKVGFYPNDCGSTTPYDSEFYQNAPDYNSATVVAITAKKTTKNINQALTPSG